MKTILWSLDRIKPYEKNPRVNDQAVDAVAASIKEFGFRQPIVVDEDGVIVVGHTRFKAAQKLELKKVPVHQAVGLTPEQIKAYRIADNQSASLSDWNHELLALELSDLKDLDFDIDLLGFGEDELAKLLGNDIEEGLTDPDSIPEPPDEPKTKPGDLWILGNHRLLCGDSSKPEDVDKLLDGARVHLVNTDPPYNVRVEPRSNNAISAGLSSFSNPNKKPTKKNNHKQFDLARHPEKANPTSKKMRAKDRPLANDFVSDGEFDKLPSCMVREHLTRAATGTRAVLLGRIRERRQLSAGVESPWFVFQPSDHLGEGASGSDAQGLHG